jgi:hypothetical protein
MLIRLCLRSAFVVLLLIPGARAAAAPEDAAASAAAWLEAQQNADGSWGTTPALRGLATSEAVIALRAHGLRRAAYFRGVAWLENHAASSNDYRARRVVALLPHGDDVSEDQQFLVDHHSLANAYGEGWGLSGVYSGSALDTALALQAFAALGVPAAVQQDVVDGVTLLVNLQSLGSDDGWPATLGANGAGDPVVSAVVLRAFAALVGYVTGQEASGDLAETWLLGAVTTADSPLAQAQAALAVLRWSPGTTSADTWLTSLEGLQEGSGSWQNDPYVTAVALQALAARLGTDAPSMQQAIFIPDLGLRAALNLALGKNRVDAVTRGEMLTLTDLDASDFGIEDLTGIEEAVNLVSIDLLGNQIADLTPLDSLPNLTKAIVASACDVNADGLIQLADAQRILSAVANNTPLPPTEMGSADVAPPGAPDGLLRVTDAVAVLHAAAGHAVPACAN